MGFYFPAVLELLDPLTSEVTSSVTLQAPTRDDFVYKTMGPLLRLMAAKIARSRGEATLTDTLPNRASTNIPRDGWPGFTLTTNLGTADENIDSGLPAMSRWPRWYVQAWPGL